MPDPRYNPKPEELTSNPVQQTVIGDLLYGGTPVGGLLDGDDSYDFANYIAALDKARAVVVKRLEHYLAFQGHARTIEQFLEAAKNGWVGWNEHED